MTKDVNSRNWGQAKKGNKKLRRNQMTEKKQSLKVPGELAVAVKTRMYEKKISWAEAAAEILKENPEIAVAAGK